MQYTKQKFQVYNRTFNNIVDAYVYKAIIKYGYGEQVAVNKKIKILDEFQYRNETMKAVFVKVNFIIYDEAGKYMIFVFTKKNAEQNETSREKLLKTFLRYYLLKLGQYPIFLFINSKTTAQLLIDILKSKNVPRN